MVTGTKPAFRSGERVRLWAKMPIEHYRVPAYLRCKTGLIVAVIELARLDNEEEGFGSNAGHRRHDYRIAFLTQEVWPACPDPAHDRPLIEVLETGV